MTLTLSTYKLLIDGKLVDGASSLEVINPATGKVLETAPKADEAQRNQAVAAAKKAFPRWSASSFEEREAVLNALADALDARADEFARILTQEQGKPLSEATAEISGAVFGLRAFGAMRTETRVLRETESERIVELRKSLGVVAAIVPWNFPLMLLVMKIGPGLITGNTVVGKPAPSTPLTTLKFGELAAQILPPGVLNIIVVDNDLGAVLTTHPDVAKVSLTGSTATGKKVMASVSSSLKRLTLELGGNDAAIVLDDADVKTIAPHIFVKDIPDTARLVREEQFGPVLPVLKYDDLADAIARANDTEYGLAGSVWTSNVERGFEVATQIDSGTVWVNKFLEVPFDVPFRGAKQSGLGGENGEEAMASYTQAKVINVAPGAGA